jgi:hypothetical protein
MSLVPPSERENAPGPQDRGAQAAKTDNQKLTESPAVVNHEYLEERGISGQTVEANGVEIIENPSRQLFKERLGFAKIDGNPLHWEVSAAIFFPCRNAAGEICSWILRPIPTIGETKFLHPKGSNPFPFVPAPTWAAQEKIHESVVLTEGPAKALALLQNGALPIGVGGVWLATAGSGDGPTELVPALKAFKWMGRTTYVAFDADYETNPAVRQALFRTVLAFTKIGAVVRIMSWESAKGIDDFLVTQPDPKAALAKLQKDAVSIEALLRAEDLISFEAELKRASLSASQLSQLSRLVADPLGIRASALEQGIAGDAKKQVNREFSLPDPEPWPEPVNGAALVGEIRSELRRYVVMSEPASIAAALWVVLTYLAHCVDVLPILAVTSPEKQCGKTTLLTILSWLVLRPLPASSVSPAALYRSIEKWAPSLVIDEADTFLADNDELRGILNSGHTRHTAHVLRINPETLEPERFSTWAPKVIACIGKLPETLIDRSIHIQMERRTPGEPVAKLRDASGEVFERLRRQAARWAKDNGEKVGQARPSVPEALDDRAGDNWFPLFQIATVAGLDLSAVTNAALALSTERSDDNLSLQILFALRAVFTPDVDFLATTNIIKHLNEDQEAPWADWKNGMTPEKLGRTLRGYKVKSSQQQKDGERHRGYLRKDLQPVFIRYLGSDALPPPESTCAPVHSPANQVPELISSAQVENSAQVQTQVQPMHAQDKKPNPCAADQVPERLGEEVHRLEPKNERTGVCEGAGRAAGNGSQPVSAQLDETSQHMLRVLQKHDFDGGLDFDTWRKEAGVPEWIFGCKVEYLIRRGCVFKSHLNGNYQLTAARAEKLKGRWA